MKLKNIDFLHGTRFYVDITNVFINSVHMHYQVRLSLSGCNLKLEEAGYKTSRQKNYRYITTQNYRYMTPAEKREQWLKDIETHIPTEVINFAFEQVKQSITYEKWGE